jgi:hypothetical protein
MGRSEDRAESLDRDRDREGEAVGGARREDGDMARCSRRSRGSGEVSADFWPEAALPAAFRLKERR